MATKINFSFIRAKFLKNDEAKKVSLEEVDFDDKEYDAFNDVKETNYCDLIKAQFDRENVMRYFGILTKE